MSKALVEKIEVVSPTHFIFCEAGIKMDERFYYVGYVSGALT